MKGVPKEREMRRVARLIAVATTALLLSVPGAAAALSRTEGGHGAATPAPSAATHDHDAGHQGVAPTPSAPVHHTGTTEPSAGHDDHSTGTTDDHSTGTTEPSGGHDEHGTTVAGTGPDADTRLLVLSLFAGVNGLVLMIASVQRTRTAGTRARRRTARAAAPPAV